MFSTVEPHDLVGWCKQVGAELSELAAYVQLSEGVLLGYARGQLALSATDRFQIVRFFDERTPPLTEDELATRRATRNSPEDPSLDQILLRLKVECLLQEVKWEAEGRFDYS